MKQILLIEDNADLAYGLRNNLEIEGYHVDVAHDGVQGLALSEGGNYDLVILDLMLPELHGFHVLRVLRERDGNVPVLILTAKGEEVDKVRGLKLGADDYMTKPFGLLELLARVEAVLRRSRKPETAAERAIEFGGISIDPATRIVTRHGDAVELTPKEYDLLVTLAKHDGAVVTRLQLMRDVWGYSEGVVTRTVDTHIAELRRKLEEDPAQPAHILTARKVGYRLRK